MDLVKVDVVVAAQGVSSAATITTVAVEAWAAPVVLHDEEDTAVTIRTITNRTDRNSHAVCPQCAAPVVVAVASRVVEDEAVRDPETMPELAETTTLSRIPLPKAPHKQLASNIAQGRERIAPQNNVTKRAP